MKKLSVIVPSYNFENYIVDCIDSIYKQETNFDFDVLLRDDNSSDNTKERLEELKLKYPNIKILDGSENLGALKNIELLLKSCNSEYIAYLDGDDLFGDEDILQQQIDFLDQNPEYVMTFTTTKYLYEDYTPTQEEDVFIISLKEEITTKDLLDTNYVGFGRVFRNKENIIKKYFEELPFVDWPINYELSKHGKIKFLDIFGGHYRISKKGMFSTLSEEEKQLNINKVKLKLKEDYNNSKYKTITIIDCFVNNESLLLKLQDAINNLKRHNHKILLVSNKVPPQDLINKVDYFLYNSENKLFKGQYENVNHVDLWKVYEGFTIHEVTAELQRHGLSVMCNLFNCLDLAKSLGYTHFQRMEVDDLFSDESYEYMKTIPKICEENNKKSLFYFNEEDISFHYFFSEIDFFLNTINRIDSEESYRTYLRNKGFKNDFKSVEVYMYHNLINSDLVLKKNGGDQMNIDFPNTKWNTETSQSTLDEFYEGCTTKIYTISGQENLAVLSFNYNNHKVIRKIIIVFDDYEQEIVHHLDYFWSWSYNIYDNKIKKIKVYDAETNEFLYEQKNENIYSYIEFK